MAFQKHQKILFIQELRKLFALMVATDRKYVDPSRVLHIFKEALDNSTNKQQVSTTFYPEIVSFKFLFIPKQANSLIFLGR